MAAALGVPTLSYAGFAFFSLLNPLATIAIAFLGFRMLRSELPVEDGQTGTG
jgi:NhaC family Na+:H+ antiporter